MFAPPIAACSPLGEITTGGEVISQGSAALTGAPATLRPWPSFQAMLRASCDTDGSSATPLAGTKQFTGPTGP